MPILHEASGYIYKAIINGKYNNSGPNFRWNNERQLYEYSNTLYPNKNYTKIFDPKSFMTRGDVIWFDGDDYRNNNKMIFDGIKLESLYTKVDDYGSVPPEYVVGDNNGEFNIGDFEDLIVHNSINWLSKQKLQEIELYKKNNEIKGKVTIQGKEWTILFDVYEHSELISISNDIDILKNNIKEYIDKLINNYDNISTRHPFNYEEDNLLIFYL